jgi:predicted dehydrogenase
MHSRREFLGKLAVSAAVPFVPGFAMAARRPRAQDERILKVAIMGLGSYGTRMARAMESCRRVKLTGIITGTPAKREAWQKKYRIPDANCYDYGNFDRIRDNPSIDAVYIITPNALHHDQALRVAAAGKHVISEKPMALNALEGRQMVAACERAGVKLLVGYRMHFEPLTLEVLRMRREGAFGPLRFFQGQSGFRIGDPTQWRLHKALSGGGAMMDIGIYAINGARYMTGLEPLWVTARETKTDPVKFSEGVDETIQFEMGFPDGVVASCLSTYNMNFLDRFYLVGDKGFAELHPATGYGPIRGRTHQGPLNSTTATQQTLQMDAMAGIILDGDTPAVPADGAEGVRDLKIIDAIYASCRTGKPIRLD